MGQYHFIVNIDKREFLHPHKFGDGLKLLEFGASGMGTMLGLAALLSDSDGRGGGDLHGDSPLVGSWAGDRIVICGDYGDRMDEAMMAVVGADCTDNLHFYASANFKDISYEVVDVICKDPYVRESQVKGRWSTHEDMPAWMKAEVEARLAAPKQ